MKFALLFVVASISFSAAPARAEHDFLAQKSLTIQSPNPARVLERTAENPKAIFLRYAPKLDSSSKVISPLQIGGTQENPTVKVSIRKCVAFICQNVDLDAEISLRETTGSCKKNYALYADLRRSSTTLSDIYDRLDVKICFHQRISTEAQLQLEAYAHRAPKYSGGVVQREIMDFLKLQVQPITQALAETLKSNGSTALLSLSHSP